MNTKEKLLRELRLEIPKTRAFLSLVPTDRFDFQPHEKSMTLGRLAAHVAEIHDWGTSVVKDDVYELNMGKYVRPSVADTDALVAYFEEKSGGLEQALDQLEDVLLDKPWKLIMGGKPVIDGTKYSVLRESIFDHVIHHRAQMSVYFRLLDIPVPPAFGRTADAPY